MPPPHMRTHENTLWILYQPVSPCSSTTVAGELGRGQERGPHLGAEGERDGERQHGHRRRGRAKARQRPLADQHQRNQQAELRLVGETAEQHAGQPRPSVELHQRAADQGRGQESVMAWPRLMNTAGKASASRQPAVMIALSIRFAVRAEDEPETDCVNAIGR